MVFNACKENNTLQKPKDDGVLVPRFPLLTRDGVDKKKRSSVVAPLYGSPNHFFRTKNARVSIASLPGNKMWPSARSRLHFPECSTSAR